MPNTIANRNAKSFSISYLVLNVLGGGGGCCILSFFWQSLIWHTTLASNTRWFASPFGT